MSSAFENLQEAIADKLRANAVLVAGGVNVLTQKNGNLESEFQRNKLKFRTQVLVFPPEGFIESLNAPGPVFKTLTIDIRITENPNPKLNKNGLSALAVAEEVLDRLHHWNPAVEGVNFLYAREGANPQGVTSEVFNIVDTFFQT